MSAPARDAFSRQAAEDWPQFLTHRERELCPGGKLTVITMAVDENGDFGAAPASRCSTALYSALLLTLADSGLSGARQRNAAHGLHQRSGADWADF